MASKRTVASEKKVNHGESNRAAYDHLAYSKDPSTTSESEKLRQINQFQSQVQELEPIRQPRSSQSTNESQTKSQSTSASSGPSVTAPIALNPFQAPEDMQTITLPLDGIARFCSSNGVPVDRLVSLLPPQLMPRVTELYAKADSDYYKSLLPKERADTLEDFIDSCGVLRENIARCRSLARAFRRSVAFEGDNEQSEVGQIFDTLLDEYEDVRLILCSPTTNLPGATQKDDESSETSAGEQDTQTQKPNKKSKRRRARVNLPDDTSEMKDDRPDRPPSPGDGGGSGRWRPTDVMEVTAAEGFSIDR